MFEVIKNKIWNCLSRIDFEEAANGTPGAAHLARQLPL